MLSEARASVAATRHDRRRLLAIGIAVLGWLAWVLAVAVSPQVELNLGTFSGGIGAVLGSFIGALYRGVTKNVPNAVRRALLGALLQAGVMTLIFGSVFVIGISLRSALAPRDSDLFVGLGLLGMILLAGSSVVWTRVKADQLKIVGVFAGLTAYFLGAFAVILASSGGADRSLAIWPFLAAVILGGLAVWLVLRAKEIERSSSVPPS